MAYFRPGPQVTIESNCTNQIYAGSWSSHFLVFTCVYKSHFTISTVVASPSFGENNHTAIGPVSAKVPALFLTDGLRVQPPNTAKLCLVCLGPMYKWRSAAVQPGRTRKLDQHQVGAEILVDSAFTTVGRYLKITCKTFFSYLLEGYCDVLVKRGIVL